ncbi:hypothetical protein MIR68_000142 [Amoeboaphelidium protococcarum]|nr:hypothetical protein MIR68_000142 [Amoeboaphelidium protococcarum]
MSNYQIFRPRNILTGTVIMTVGIVLSVSIACLVYMAMYSLLVPSTVYQEFPLRLEYDYNHMNIHAIIPSVRLNRLSNRQTYDWHLVVKLSQEKHNYDGLWPVSACQLSDKQSKSQESVQSNSVYPQKSRMSQICHYSNADNLAWRGSSVLMLKYQSRALKWLNIMLRLPLYVFGYYQEYEMVQLKLESDKQYKYQRSYHQKSGDLYLTIAGSRDSDGKVKLPRIVTALMISTAQFVPYQLAYYLYHYRFLTGLVVVSLIAFSLLTVYYACVLVYLWKQSNIDAVEWNKRNLQKDYAPLMDSIKYRQRSMSKKKRSPLRLLASGLRLRIDNGKGGTQNGEDSTSTSTSSSNNNSSNALILAQNQTESTSTSSQSSQSKSRSRSRRNPSLPSPRQSGDEALSGRNGMFADDDDDRLSRERYNTSTQQDYGDAQFDQQDVNQPLSDSDDNISSDENEILK